MEETTNAMDVFLPERDNAQCIVPLYVTFDCEHMELEQIFFLETSTGPERYTIQSHKQLPTYEQIPKLELADCLVVGNDFSQHEVENTLIFVMNMFLNISKKKKSIFAKLDTKTA